MIGNKFFLNDKTYLLLEVECSRCKEKMMISPGSPASHARFHFGIRPGYSIHFHCLTEKEQGAWDQTIEQYLKIKYKGQ